MLLDNRTRFIVALNSFTAQIDFDAVARPGRDTYPEEVLVLPPDRTVKRQRGGNCSFLVNYKDDNDVDFVDTNVTISLSRQRSNRVCPDRCLVI